MYTKDKSKLNKEYFKRNTGITLVALIISIIVILLLAGFTFNATIGENGIITKAANSKSELSKDEAAAEVSRAFIKYYDVVSADVGRTLNSVSNILGLQQYLTGRVNGLLYNDKNNKTRVYYSTGTTSYTIEVNMNGDTKIYDGLLIDADFENEFYVGDGEQVTFASENDEYTYWEIAEDSIGLIEIDENTKKPTVKRKAPGEAKIYVYKTLQDKEMGVDPIIITIKDIERTVLAVADEPTNNTGGDVINNSVNGKYLVDIAVIGDYVDIGIEYDDMESTGDTNDYSGFYESAYITNNAPLKGWRVIDIQGSGENGIVKLVSSGSTLSFYYKVGESSIAISMLNNILNYPSYSLITKGSVTDDVTGFITNKLKKNNTINDNMYEIFTSSPYVDISKGVHAFADGSNYSGTENNDSYKEVERLYQVITSEAELKTMRQFYDLSDNIFSTSTLKTLVGERWNNKYNDLLANGQFYRLGGVVGNGNYLWDVSSGGRVRGHYDGVYGVRPVVTLKAGVKVSDTNTGDGNSFGTSYQLYYDESIEEDIPVFADDPVNYNSYLADIAMIGDYVDIGIEYDNMTPSDGTAQYYIQGYRDGAIKNSAPLNGWRVIDVQDSGELGTVKVVSAGSALSYYYYDGYGSNYSLGILNDLNRTITPSDGFVKNNLKKDGVINNNLNEVFTSSPYVDISKGVHALSAGSNSAGTESNNNYSELEYIYEQITGQRKRMNQLIRLAGDGRYYQNFSTKKMRQEATSHGRGWNNNYNDLLTNGQYYWLGGVALSENRLWNVDGYGEIYYENRDAFGVRPVVTLKPGVQISSTNTGDGNSFGTAYQLYLPD